jgi:uncharacterized damage-inducible protein DinB
MNRLIEEELPGNLDLRDQLLELITDQDLAYKLPGDNPTLGQLCEEMGRIQQIYAKSFRTLEMDWKYRGSSPQAPNSVAALVAWFAALDAELLAALSELSDDDLESKQVDRGHGFNPALFVQFQIYREALLIFYAKASVYLKALGKPYNQHWKAWVG